MFDHAMLLGQVTIMSSADLCLPFCVLEFPSGLWVNSNNTLESYKKDVIQRFSQSSNLIND